MKLLCIWLAVPLLIYGLSLAAADAPAAATTGLSASETEAIHAELRALKDPLVAAINRGEYDKLLPYLNENCVVTWQNGEVSRHPAGVKTYYDKMTTGPGHLVDTLHVELTVDELSILYGADTALAWGGSQEHFKLTDGTEFILHGRWSALLHKEGGTWQIANAHSSTNVFDNPILDFAKKWMLYAAIGAGLAGLIVGGGLVAFLKRRKPA